jgi:hypothetical protein
MTSRDYEREFVRAELALQQERFDRAAAEMQADLDLYRDDFTTRHAEQLRAHERRMRELEEQNRAYLTSFYDDGDEGSRTDVGPGFGASASESAPVPGAGPGQPDPREAELAEAERIRLIPLQEWAQVRRSMIRASNGLFG